jgi:hypothetical protein
VKNYERALDNEVCGFVTENNSCDWKKGADVQGGVGNGFLSAGGMVRHGWFNINCCDKDAGVRMWERSSIKSGVLGDPDPWTELRGSGLPWTVLIANPACGKLRSLDPETGEDTWLLDCRDCESWGIKCQLKPQGSDGIGTMALSPEKEVVPIMAAEVLIQPTPAPTTNPSMVQPPVPQRNLPSNLPLPLPLPLLIPSLPLLLLLLRPLRHLAEAIGGRPSYYCQLGCCRVVAPFAAI